MKTEEYISIISEKTRRRRNVALKQSAVYELKCMGYAPSIIRKVFNVTQSHVDYMTSMITDMLKMNDSVALEAKNETDKHKLEIVPKFIDNILGGKILTYELFIDNQKYNSYGTK